jgi:hypothetical protein
MARHRNLASTKRLHLPVKSQCALPSASYLVSLKTFIFAVVKVSRLLAPMPPSGVLNLSEQ